MKPPAHPGEWPCDIGSQNGKPHDENSKRRVGVAAEKFVECGGPPHADRSRGREKHDEARTLRQSIERVGKRSKIRDLLDRRTCSAVDNQVDPRATRERHHRDSDEEDYPDAFRHERSSSQHRRAQRVRWNDGLTVLARLPWRVV